MRKMIAPNLPKARRIADDSIYLHEDRYENPKELFRFIGSLIDRKCPAANIDILDVGCATGEFIYYLRHKYPQSKCVGIDVSEVMIQKARRKLPTETWQCKEVLTTPTPFEKQFDIVLCVGVLQIFDNVEIPIANLVSGLKEKGFLYIAGIFNSNPVDVITRYRTLNNENYSEWQLGWNVFSTQTYDKILHYMKTIQWEWHDFKMPFAIKKTGDLMRTWTISTDENPFQLINGASQLINIKVLEIRKERSL